jgi:hypothetical protein
VRVVGCGVLRRLSSVLPFVEVRPVISIGAFDAQIIFSETLPTSRRFDLPLPCVSVAMRSEPLSFATSRMARAVLEWRVVRKSMFTPSALGRVQLVRELLRSLERSAAPLLIQRWRALREMRPDHLVDVHEL